MKTPKKLLCVLLCKLIQNACKESSTMFLKAIRPREESEEGRQRSSAATKWETKQKLIPLCTTLSFPVKLSWKNSQGSTKHFLIALQKGSMQNQHSCGQGQHCWLQMMCPHECKHWQPQLCRDQPAVMQLGLGRHSVSSSFPFLFLYCRRSAISDLTSGAGGGHRARQSTMYWCWWLCVLETAKVSHNTEPVFYFYVMYPCWINQHYITSF